MATRRLSHAGVPPRLSPPGADEGLLVGVLDGLRPRASGQLDGGLAINASLDEQTRDERARASEPAAAGHDNAFTRLELGQQRVEHNAEGDGIDRDAAVDDQKTDELDPRPLHRR